MGKKYYLMSMLAFALFLILIQGCTAQYGSGQMMEKEPMANEETTMKNDTGMMEEKKPMMEEESGMIEKDKSMMKDDNKMK